MPIPAWLLGGIGLFGRWQAAKIVGLELGVRSGSLRYRNAADVISQDIVMGEAGVLLYLYRGAIGQFALDAGGGALVHAIRYELAGRPNWAPAKASALPHWPAPVSVVSLVTPST